MMRSILSHKPSPALVVACLALFVSIGGTSYAITTIGSAQIANNSIRSVDIKNNEVSGQDVRNGTLHAADFAAGELRAGAAGARGLPGAAGTPGTPGTPGAPGATGPRGPQGAEGARAPVAAGLYAHVDDTGALDASRSTAGIAVTAVTFGVSPSDWTVYCFALPQAVVNVTATIESSRTTFMGQVGFNTGPLNATVVPSEIAVYPCPGTHSDAAALVPKHPSGTSLVPLYAAFQ